MGVSQPEVKMLKLKELLANVNKHKYNKRELEALVVSMAYCITYHPRSWFEFQAAYFASKRSVDHGDISEQAKPHVAIGMPLLEELEYVESRLGSKQ